MYMKTTTPKNSTPFTFRLDNETKKQLEQEAIFEDRSAASLATRAIKSMLAAKSMKRTAVEEALAKADKGEFISQESMHNWMKSWDTDEELPMPTI